MLSRVADSLYWMGRHIERADNLARLLSVSSSFLLDARAGTGRKEGDFWRPILFATSMADAFDEICANDAEADVGYFMALDERNPECIRESIAQARENARMVRDQISEEMWVELNSIHLFLRSGEVKNLWAESPQEFFRKIEDFSLLFQGLTDATVTHSDGWRFVLLGRYLERADKTSRILDILTYATETDRNDCAAVLRSCSAFSGFREEFRGDVSLENVAAFLLFSQEFPRSVRFCVRQIDKLLHDISGVAAGAYSNEAERVAGEVLARLNFSGINDVQMRGLHQYIDDLQEQLNEIGQRIFETYVLLPSEVQSTVIVDGARLQFQMQQQQQQQ